MRFLVDECLSARLVNLLTAAGHDAVYADDRGLAGKPDTEVLAQTVTGMRIPLSADTDWQSPRRVKGSSMRPGLPGPRPCIARS
ncbi:MAG: DUF5615 family PIN-like protein [Longispora sp.]|nr:DUF5615 family PIN-like protein [Longispora sp. (in: high G+C Gram-positive bacteria)]